MIALTARQWERLYAQVLLVTTKRTSTRVESRKATQADKAAEATQEAFDRLYRLDPPGLDTLEAVYGYLVWAARSELSNALAEAEARGKAAQAAGEEQAATVTFESPSPEAMHLEASEQADEQSVFERRMAALKRELERTKDTRALQTLDCIERGVITPAAQATELNCPVEEIYNARKRRERAARMLVEAEGGDGDGDGDGDEEDEDGG